MTRAQYMKRLADCLQGLPEQERRDALNYYEEYFDAAGPEAEEQTIRELGSPETVAQKIREDLGGGPAESRYGYTLEPRKNRLAAFWAGLSAPGRVLCVALSALAAVSVTWQLRPLLGALTGRDRIVTEVRYESVASGIAEPVTEDSSPALQPDVAENVLQEGTETVSPAESALIGSLSQSGWTRPLPEFEKLEIICNGAEFAVTVVPSAESPMLVVDGLAQDQLRVTDDGGKTTVESLIQRPKGWDEGGLVTLVLPSEQYLDALDLTVNAGALTVPELWLRELKLEVNGGSVTLDSLEASETAKLELNAGSIDVRSLTAQTAEVTVNAGSITLQRLDCGKAELEANVGSIEVEELGFAELELDCDAGSISVQVLGTADQYSLQGECTLGSIRYDGESLESIGELSVGGGAGLPIDAECKMGEIQIDFLG